MKTIELKLYDIMELKDEAFRKAVDDNRGINIMHNWWYCDGLLDLSRAEMEEIGVELSKEWYKSDKPKNERGNIIGEYPAYTGLVTYKIADFDLDRANYVQFEDIKINDDEVFRKYLQLSPEVWSKVYYEFINDNKENTRIEFCTDGSDYLKLEEIDKEAIERAEEIFARKVVEARRQLHQMYEDLQTEDAIVDTFQANEYTFLEDGTMYNA